jgi:hypothetical protein
MAVDGMDRAIRVTIGFLLAVPFGMSMIGFSSVGLSKVLARSEDGIEADSHTLLKTKTEEYQSTRI